MPLVATGVVSHGGHGGVVGQTLDAEGSDALVDSIERIFCSAISMRRQERLAVPGMGCTYQSAPAFHCDCHVSKDAVMSWVVVGAHTWGRKWSERKSNGPP